MSNNSNNNLKQDLDHHQLSDQSSDRRPRGFAAAASADGSAAAGPKGRREREKEKERTKLRERHRRAITSRMLAGLRQYGNFPLPARADMNDVLAALAREAGWTVEPDGTTYRPSPAAPAPPAPQLVIRVSLFARFVWGNGGKIGSCWLFSAGAVQAVAGLSCFAAADRRELVACVAGLGGCCGERFQGGQVCECEPHQLAGVRGG